jgi:exodeoxyribonuclease-1
MDQKAAKRLAIDVEKNLQHRDKLLRRIDELAQKTRLVFNQQDFPALADPDAQLYSGGFFSNEDYNRMQNIRSSAPEELAELDLRFDDKRLPEMLFRYRARNYPETLNADEQQRWNAYRRQRFTDPASGNRTLNQVKADIQTLRIDPNVTGSRLAILDELENYLERPDFFSL